MFRSTLVLLLASVLCTVAVGCVSSASPAVAFEPRVYPYVPELGPDGPSAEGNAVRSYNVQR